MAIDKRLDAYGLSEAPEAQPAYRAQRLHELGITAAEETDWQLADGSSNVWMFRFVPDDPYPLQVKFLNGSTYGYVAPRAVYEGMLEAESRGGYVWHILRKDGYPYLRLS